MKPLEETESLFFWILDKMKNSKSEDSQEKLSTEYKNLRREST